MEIEARAHPKRPQLLSPFDLSSAGPAVGDNANNALSGPSATLRNPKIRLFNEPFKPSPSATRVTSSWSDAMELPLGLRRYAHASSKEILMPDTQDIEGKFWEAPRSDMTVMLGVSGVHDVNPRPITAQIDGDADQRPICFLPRRPAG